MNYRPQQHDMYMNDNGQWVFEHCWWVTGRTSACRKLDVGLLVATIWLELCMFYNCSCHHHLHRLATTNTEWRHSVSANPDTNRENEWMNEWMRLKLSKYTSVITSVSDLVRTCSDEKQLRLCQTVSVFAFGWWTLQIKNSSKQAIFLLRWRFWLCQSCQSLLSVSGCDV